MIKRRALIAKALRLEWITVAWMVIEAAVAIGSGIMAHSLTLIAFGADSIIELASACELIRRLAIEIDWGEAGAAELRASLIELRGSIHVSDASLKAGRDIRR